jgi:hypothetical protein
MGSQLNPNNSIEIGMDSEHFSPYRSDGKLVGDSIDADEAVANLLW